MTVLAKRIKISGPRGVASKSRTWTHLKILLQDVEKRNTVIYTRIKRKKRKSTGAQPYSYSSQLRRRPNLEKNEWAGEKKAGGQGGSYGYKEARGRKKLITEKGGEGARFNNSHRPPTMRRLCKSPETRNQRGEAWYLKGREWGI